MIAIDWSHTKDLTTYDGKKARVETLKQLTTRLSKTTDGEDSKASSKSVDKIHSPSVILEQGCPLSLIYTLTSHNIEVKLIDNHATEAYRKEHGIEKTDENDAKIIYELASNGSQVSFIAPDFKMLQLTDLYHQYCRYQKARVAMENMKKAHKRQYGVSGDEESKPGVISSRYFHPSPDFLAYDIAIDTFKGKEKGLLKNLDEIMKGVPLFEMAGESRVSIKSIFNSQPAIKGLGKRIWLGLIVTANPSNFKCLSAYLRFCGLTEDTFKNTHRYNRHARMLYYMLAESVLKQKDPTFRPIYDKCKADFATKHPNYKKGYIHNAAMTRLSTFLAKTIFYSVGGESTREINSICVSQPPNAPKGLGENNGRRTIRKRCKSSDLVAPPAPTPKGN